MTQLEKNWFLFFRALGARDAVAVAQQVDLLLKTDRTISVARMKYLVYAGMASNIALGKKDKARLLWSGYGDTAYGGKEPGMLLKLLISLCEVQG